MAEPSWPERVRNNWYVRAWRDLLIVRHGGQPVEPMHVHLRRASTGLIVSVLLLIVVIRVVMTRAA